MPDKKNATPAAGHNIARVLQDLNLEVRYLPTNSLVRYGRNIRPESPEQIEASAKFIAEFGFIPPIIVDEADRLLHGNIWVEAARLQGLRTVPVVTAAGLSDPQKRILAVALHRLPELADWDRETLAIEFKELRELNIDLDLELTGFTDPQIDALIVCGGSGNEENADRVPMLPLSATSRLGDDWVLGDHRLVCGDATDPEMLMRVLRGEAVRTVFTDVPYNVRVSGHITKNPRHGEFVMASGEMSDEEFAAFLARVWTNIEKALAPGGLAYFCMDWRGVRPTLVSMDGLGLELLNLIVWNKKTGGMGSFYRSQHELVFLVKKVGAPHVNCVQLGSNGRNRTNVWDYPGMNGFGAEKARARDLHPTVKPMAMVRDAILDSSAVGDVVLDLFSGSGTTLIAAEVSKRKGRAIELDPRYTDTSLIRWQDFTGKQATLAATGETFAEVRARRAPSAPTDEPAIAATHAPGEPLPETADV